MSRIRAFFKKEPVLTIAAAAAVLSMFLVPPSAAYIDYIDVRVLCLLFCLMAVVAGLQRCGLFELLSRKLLGGSMSLRRVVILLVLLPFFSSMLVTNDVALITFVPFALLVLDTVGRREQAIFVVALQTAAANLGSMATPVGNPQNLCLYANYQLTPGRFFALMVPLTLSMKPWAAITPSCNVAKPCSSLRVRVCCTSISMVLTRYTPRLPFSS